MDYRDGDHWLVGGRFNITYGCISKSVGTGLNCSLGCTGALSLSVIHSTAAVAVCGKCGAI